MSHKINTLSRRHAIALMGGAAGIFALRGTAFAQQTVLEVLAHRVHQTAATDGAGGDLIGPFSDDTGLGVSWTVLGDNNAIHERLLREVSLSNGAIDVGYMLNRYATPKNLSLFEPLDSFMQENPIQEMEDFSPGLIAPMQQGGQLFGLPVRHATNTLIYNEKLMDERNIELPKTFEDFLEAAKAGTYKREDGQDVFGLTFSGLQLSYYVSMARAYGGDYMTADGQITVTSEPVIKGLTALADLYKAGALPRGFTAMSGDESTIIGNQGRALFQLANYASLVRRNRAEESGDFAGAFKPMHMPMTTELVGVQPYSDTIEFWSIMIPKNGSNKEGAYALIRALTTPEAQVTMALNGNGPTRLSVYSAPEVTSLLPFAALEAEALSNARPHLPAFNEVSRVQDIFLEESQAAVLGHKTPEQAMGDAERRAAPLLQA